MTVLVRVRGSFASVVEEEGVVLRSAHVNGFTVGELTFPTESNDETVPAGNYGWFSGFDLGKGKKGPRDRSTLLGFGDEAANEAFCASPNLPRFGPWDVKGDIKVKVASPHHDDDDD